ncbi:MAG TPA: DUF1707 domain-containing protein [Amycolatopsis sp.]|uniref:DUF1707 SHOCT-like domain-containing protein n=1 Tax=Amycolatopsis sp. TaxID=37632 RepID=UPI002B4AA52D|nr:DUF1707 domain-containing protein [Amycolatopsis sp.]HKS47676.1 DUF1707 domain-containing protein [Amycolatopsis sp.]
MNESPDVRIGDADRERALQALGEHMSAGRLDLNEYGERSAKVTAARTQRELTELFGDLPEPHPTFGTSWATVAQPTAKQAVAWVDRPLNQRLVAAALPLLWVAGIVIGLSTGVWWFMALPFVATAVGRGLWGQGWERDQRRDRERRRELRDRDRDRP